MSKREPLDWMCSHDWQLERPDSPKTIGVCKFCGSRAVFMNSLLNMDLTAQINVLSSGLR